ncbi:clamp loader of DNA polymerase [Klebsiella phage vB_KpnM_KpS110]|uniref:Sliding-clamp-loader small subunit n=4 Tax=Taipeivirus TaxID=2731621 RepID=A0A482N0I9_9CAUD|nr:clamp loader of DNA polymerase [Klebsiella phage Menlow]YP_009798941.1 clamp loader of DNA polymerase [Klebsiella phage vB_KpnM_KpS110]YP_009822560.1 clamp loader of DNA polymerase [Escherichia phage vB_EcoM_KWBSE43-6]UPW36048.1 clamp loader subunit [Klebsiella phage K751]URG13679.1 clamp holder for DNA polymerase [Klebsiella phage T751]URG17999.1 clamp loader subunit [Klebsiella phage T765]WJJ58857.1 clamp loader subunit [Klebsiella phage vB_KpnS_MDA2066]AUG87795.1 clamp loader subunit [
MAAPSLFDFLGALNNTKENLLQTDDPDVRKAFDPFMTRRGLAQNKDTLVIAQRMNLLHKVTPWMQWNMAFHSIPARKRYGKWAKKGPLDPDIQMLSEYYYISHEKASEYLKFLPKEALAEIRKKVELSNSNEKAKPRKAK